MPIQSHLKALFSIVHTGEATKEESFVKLLTFIAYKLKLDAGMVSPTLSLDVWNSLDASLDLDLLKSVPNEDHLGLFLKKYIDPSTTQYLPPQKITKKISSLSFEGLPKYGAPVLDEDCGTGGLILELHKQNKHRMYYYGTTDNKVSYYICLIQMYLNTVPSRILLITQGDTSYAIGSANWSYANMWQPPREHPATWEKE